MKDETPTNSELFRSQTEIKQAIKESDAMHVKWHEENHKSLDDLNRNQIIANGRTGNNEKAIALLGDDYARMASSVTDLKGDRRWILGAAATLILLQGVLAFFARLYIADVARDVVTATLQSYDIQIIK